MSSSLSSYAPPPPPPSPSAPILGLGYIIAIGVAVLILLSSLLLASYLFLRQRRRNHSPSTLPVSSGNSVMLPRIIFVAEDDDDDGTGGVGLDAAVINSYPRFPYQRNGGCGDGERCAICLCEYREGEMMRMLPDCRHVFHLGCVDAWLKLNASCPVCRTSPLPTPLSTPLSELVPLSQYSNGRRQR